MGIRRPRAALIVADKSLTYPAWEIDLVFRGLCSERGRLTRAVFGVGSVWDERCGPGRGARRGYGLTRKWKLSRPTPMALGPVHGPRCLAVASKPGAGSKPRLRAYATAPNTR